MRINPGLLATIIFLSSLLGFESSYLHRPDKHTGACQFIYKDMTGSRFWFSRPNGEIFEMYYDNPPAFGLGIKFSDITYKDDGPDHRLFIKAKVDGGK